MKPATNRKRERARTGRLPDPESLLSEALSERCTFSPYRLRERDPTNVRLRMANGSPGLIRYPMAAATSLAKAPSSADQLLQS
jgi:hypothetical protein